MKYKKAKGPKHLLPCYNIIDLNPAWCFVIENNNARNLLMYYGNRVSMLWPCMVILNRETVIRYYYSLPIKAAPFWLQQMSLHVDWT